MSTLGDGSTTIAQLRVRASGVEPLIARARLDGVLGRTDLHPTALSPSAILVVRGLDDPRPGALRLDRAQQPVEWQRAAAAAMDDQLRRAARPSRGAVPPGADAVLFADRAELLGCLLSDWCAGTIGLRWWWRLLGWEAQPIERATTELFAAPELLPPVFAQLAGRQLLVPMLHALEHAEALLRVVIERLRWRWSFRRR